ncbi:MAG: Crp/Fnr family transcriptional regulator [Pseudomonadota bacterium]
MNPDNVCGLPALADLPPLLAGEVARLALPLEAPAGTCLFDAGSPCQALPLLLAGDIKVSKRAENGREIRLYGVHPGELCIVTVSCLLGGVPYPATGVAETPVSAVTLPRPLFLRLTAEHPPFRERVFSLFSERLTGLMQLVEEVAFRKLDQRLAAWLVARGPTIAASHQSVADELGSVREIVSRLLKQFADQGWVRLGRERIEVLDPAALRRLAMPV